MQVSKRDIIFLIDSTMGQTFINTLREFIKRFVDIMPIGPDKVQVGIAQFSDTPRLVMDLNTHGTKEEIIANLASLRARPGQTVNIGAALDFVRTNMVLPEKGSRIRQRVPQLLLLVSSKPSSDDVEEPANALMRMGVLTMAVGSRAANEQQLRQIAFVENVLYMLKDFRQLIRDPKNVIDALSTLAGEVTEQPTDPGNPLSSTSPNVKP